MEVLISIALLGLILPALYRSVDLLRDSNQHLLGYLEKSKKISKATQTLYLDILNSDGNITIKKDEFSRLCIEETRNSLYALPSAKVCWIVLKKDNTLARVEGNGYHLPVGTEERVEIDPLMQNVALFDVYHEKDKVLVLLQLHEQEPISFMVQGVEKPKKKKKKKEKKTKKKKLKKSTTPPSPETNGTTPPSPPPSAPLH
jgi:hypothetical protein